MIHRFLSAKHWHIFMLILVLPIIIHFVNMIFLFDEFRTGFMTQRPPSVIKFFPGFFLIMFLQLFGIFGWMWSVSVGLHSKLPSSMRMNLKQFKFFFIFPLVYLLVFMVYMLVIFTKMDGLFNNPNPRIIHAEILPLFFGIFLLFPLHLFSMFCMGYCFQFSAKTLKSIELGRRAETAEYIGEFFMFWFNFVGVWIMQPRISNIYYNFPDQPRRIELETPLSPTDDFSTLEQPIKEVYPRGEKLYGKDHDAFRNDDEFDGII